MLQNTRWAALNSDLPGMILRHHQLQCSHREPCSVGQRGLGLGQGEGVASVAGRGSGELEVSCV